MIIIIIHCLYSFLEAEYLMVSIIFYADYFVMAKQRIIHIAHYSVYIGRFIEYSELKSYTKYLTESMVYNFTNPFNKYLSIQHRLFITLVLLWWLFWLGWDLNSHLWYLFLFQCAPVWIKFYSDSMYFAIIQMKICSCFLICTLRRSSFSENHIRLEIIQP